MQVCQGLHDNGPVPGPAQQALQSCFKLLVSGGLRLLPSSGRSCRRKNQKRERKLHVSPPSLDNQRPNGLRKASTQAARQLEHLLRQVALP